MAESPTTKPRQLWRVVLIISLALNFIIVGIVAGAALSGRLGKGAPRSFDLGQGPLARALSQQDRRAIGQSLRRGSGDLRRQDMRAQTEALVSQLRQDPFDPAALRSLLDTQDARLDQLRLRAKEALVARIADMSPQERAAFADRLEIELRRPRRGHGNRSGG